jgi:Fe-S-cluster containining protein
VSRRKARLGIVSFRHALRVVPSLEQLNVTAGFICDRCSTCCFTHRVPLTRADLKRLIERGKDPADFVEFLRPEDADLTGEPESLAQLAEGRRLLALRHVGEGQDSRCTFLGEDGCRVHASRPMACRSYPYDRPETVGALGLVPHYLCPEKSGVLVTLRRSQDEAAEFHRDVHEFSLAVRQRDQEASDHAEWLFRWNKAQRMRIKLGKLPRSSAELLRELSC